MLGSLSFSSTRVVVVLKWDYKVSHMEQSYLLIRWCGEYYHHV